MWAGSLLRCPSKSYSGWVVTLSAWSVASFFLDCDVLLIVGGSGRAYIHPVRVSEVSFLLGSGVGTMTGATIASLDSGGCFLPVSKLWTDSDLSFLVPPTFLSIFDSFVVQSLDSKMRIPSFLMKLIPLSMTSCYGEPEFGNAPIVSSVFKPTCMGWRLIDIGLSLSRISYAASWDRRLCFVERRIPLRFLKMSDLGNIKKNRMGVVVIINCHDLPMRWVLPSAIDVLRLVSSRLVNLSVPSKVLFFCLNKRMRMAGFTLSLHCISLSQVSLGIRGAFVFKELIGIMG